LFQPYPTEHIDKACQQLWDILYFTKVEHFQRP
ncbi:unnamed protein product, partial [Heterotrigona itama]